MICIVCGNPVDDHTDEELNRCCMIKQIQTLPVKEVE